MLKALIKTAGFALVITTTSTYASNGPDIIPQEICEFFPFDCPSIELKPNAQASKTNIQANKTNR